MMTERLSHAFWILAPGKGEIRARTLTAPTADTLAIKTLYSGISRGTEALIWRGEVPSNQYQRMRAPFQEGEFPGPIKYGYANVGQVEHGPSEWQGRVIFALYPHESYYHLPIANAFLLPAKLPPERAILAANTETALNACWDAALQPGEKVRVIGGGVVGCLIAAICQAIPGADVELIDINPAREAVANALGVPFVMPNQATDEADVVIHSSASEQGLALALELAGDEARVIEVSWYGDRSVSLSLGEHFHSRRLTLRSSQVGGIPPSMQPRWNYRRRMQKALDLLATQPQWDELIDGESDFTALPETMGQLAHGQGLCQRIRYEES
ncbi:MAG: zinc-binding alcohol dehydrogenase [Spiribacter sp.]|jgi:hypothetical protein|nr:zinc-binding alcohol dehydrogenase [Spiribacter sp.]MDR9488925.1 zinc-binding alcohol dehydrogenase [Spiribacter sp.]